VTKPVRVAALAFYYLIASHLPDLAFPGGRVFNKIRCATLRAILPAFGQGNEIDSRVYVGDGSDISIGSSCQINRGCRLDRVSIGNSVMLGPDVIVIGQLHHSEDLEVPMASQGKYTKAPTTIDDDVWIGARAILMPGVAVARGAIVGAGDIAAYHVVGGVPARKIRRRSDEASG
jgi:maltose O-acetyltransferase